MPENKKKVIVCGYQKSGTTWATRLVAQLLGAPSAGYWGYEGKTFVVEGEQRESELVCYQSHHMLSELQNSSEAKIDKVIYIVRDPRDIVVSGIFHFKFYSHWLEHLIKQAKFPHPMITLLKSVNARSQSRNYRINRMLHMLKHGDGFIEHCHWSWNDHVMPYLEGKDILVIRYEDLLLSGLETAKCILEYAQMEKPEKDIENDLKLQSFPIKKKAFDQRGEKIKVKHMRKGIVGDWKNSLSPDHVQAILRTHGELMQRLNYI
ncbi:MAG TPA: sulfotransferase domain-containing protein [Eudoraea sp.]|nr:sulfotransferase domain-containing protein [Eudoraea sp.]